MSSKNILPLIFVFFLLPLFVLLLSNQSFAIPLNECQTISTSGHYDLMSDVSSPRTCFNVTTSSVTIDCHGYSIFYATQGYGYGINVTNDTSTIINGDFTNITIRDCFITSNSTYGDNDAIRFNNVSNSLVYNNTIFMLDNGGAGLDAFGGSNVNVSYNNFTHITNQSDAIGISFEVRSLDHLIFRNSFWLESYNDGVTGIQLFDACHNGSIIANEINAFANDTFGNSGDIITLSNSHNVTISDNTVFGNSTDAFGLDGISIFDSDFVVTIFNRVTIHGNKSTSLNIQNTGITTRDSYGGLISDNNIFLNGSADVGIFLTYLASDGVNNTYFFNNTITMDSTNSYGFYVRAASHNVFENNVVNMTTESGNEWYETWVEGFIPIIPHWFSTNNTFYNLTAVRNNASISFASFNGSSIQSLVLDQAPTVPTNLVALNKFFNITNLTGHSWLNLNITYSDNDFVSSGISDESTLRLYRLNESNNWTNISFYSPGVYGFDTTNNLVFANITSFSTFGIFGDPSSNDLSACQIINAAGSYTLTQNVTSGGSCFAITASDVSLDCGGFTIEYGTLGRGFAVNVSNGDSGLSNVSITSCNTVRGAGNATGNYGVAFTNVNSSSVSQTVFVTNGVLDNHGIFLSHSFFNTFTGINITTNTTTSSGFLLTNSSHNQVTNALVNATDSTAFDIQIDSSLDSFNNTLSNVTLGRNGLVISALTFNGSTIKAVTSSEAPTTEPADQVGIGRFLNLSNTSLGSWLHINISYAETDVASFNIGDEDTLRIWRFDNTGTPVNTDFFSGSYGVDTTNNVVFANLTNFSTFGLFGEEAVAPLADNGGGGGGGGGGGPIVIPPGEFENIFIREVYEFDGTRDFNSFPIRIQNPFDDKNLTISADVTLNSKNIPANFIGAGTLDNPVFIKPLEQFSLTFGASFDTANDRVYTFNVSAYNHIGTELDSATIIINLPKLSSYSFTIDPPIIDFAIDDVSDIENICRDSVSEFTITNNGNQPISDLTFDTSDVLIPITLYPHLKNYKLEEGDSITIKVTSFFDQLTPSSNSKIKVRGAAIEKGVGVMYTSPGGIWAAQPKRVNQFYTASARSFICVNRPSYIVDLDLPEPITQSIIKKAEYVGTFEKRCQTVQKHDTDFFINGRNFKSIEDSVPLGTLVFPLEQTDIKQQNKIKVSTSDYQSGGHFCANAHNTLRVFIDKVSSYCPLCVPNQEIESNFADGIDNDCDGEIDCGDLDSCGVAACATENEHICPDPEIGQCADGIDNDGNGLLDCKDIIACCNQAVCSDAVDCRLNVPLPIPEPENTPQIDLDFEDEEIEDENVTAEIVFDPLVEESVSFSFTNREGEPIINFEACVDYDEEDSLPAYWKPIVKTKVGSLRPTGAVVNENMVVLNQVNRALVDKIEPGETVDGVISVELPVTSRKILPFDVVYTSSGKEIARDKSNIDVIQDSTATAVRVGMNHTLDMYAVLSHNELSDRNQDKRGSLFGSILPSRFSDILEDEITVEMNVQRPPSKDYNPSLGIRGLIESVRNGPQTASTVLFGPYEFKETDQLLLAQQFAYDPLLEGEFDVEFTFRKGTRVLAQQKHRVLLGENYVDVAPKRTLTACNNNQDCRPHYECSSWQPCNPDGVQHRTCVDLNSCADAIEAGPIVEQSCTYVASCFNEVKDGNEEGVDCGGECSACVGTIVTRTPGLYLALKNIVLFLMLFIILVIIYGGYVLSGYVSEYHERKKRIEEMMEQLDSYVKGALSKGYNFEQIKKALEKHGWHKDIIEYYSLEYLENNDQNKN